jgi:DNA repair ATPase RecN
VTLANRPTIIFDDVGVGGAAAAAVGERLQRLGDELQVLVVTHSPQVAAHGKGSGADRARPVPNKYYLPRSSTNN